MAKSKKRKKLQNQVDKLLNKQNSKSKKKKAKVASLQLTKAPGKRVRQVLKSVTNSTGDITDYSYTQNREESWLRFDARVLDEALDETVPLFERLKFVSIFGSNLDEWFMVRIGGLSDLALLKHQPIDTRSGMTPSEQIENALSMLPEFIARQAAIFTGLEANLAGAGLTRVHASDLTDVDLRKVARHFDTRIAPIISPMIVDPRHPFPNLKNGRLYVVCELDGPDEEGLLGVIEVPHSLTRVVELPSTTHNYRYMLVEDVILSRLSECFGAYQPTSSAIIRVTRNADVDPDGDGIAEDSDYRAHMQKVLKKRLRLQAVRLELEGTLEHSLEDFIVNALSLTESHVFHTTIPLDLGYVFSLESKAAAVSNGRLLYEPFEPQRSPIVNDARPMREQVEERDILLTYPYQSMSPLLRLLREASNDDACISIKVTLYRVASQSKLCESLIAAVENGKEVTVLMELRARFDEENNIAWAERLENAGCTVIYGSEGFKCHSKICQITYHDAGSIRRITCLGTGNFNEKTARLYSDFMLLTSHEGIGEDGNTFFRNLSLGNLYGTYRYLGVAPVGLKPLVMRGLDREIARARSGEPSFVFMKMNSLTDRDVIDKIAEACQAGVPVVMIVRGITCIRANVPGKTEGLLMRQIVGRFLEHARIYAFGIEADTLYLSSADMMTRNTEHRVEIAYPVLDEYCRKEVVRFINLQLADNAKARQLASDGTWEQVYPKPGEPLINSQELLLALAEREAREPVGDRLAALIPCSGVEVRLSSETLRRIVAIPSTEVVPVEDAAATPEDEADVELVDEDVELALDEQEAAAETETTSTAVPDDTSLEDDEAEGSSEDAADDIVEEAEAAEGDTTGDDGAADEDEVSSDDSPSVEYVSVYEVSEPVVLGDAKASDETAPEEEVSAQEPVTDEQPAVAESSEEEPEEAAEVAADEADGKVVETANESAPDDDATEMTDEADGDSTEDDVAPASVGVVEEATEQSAEEPAEQEEVAEEASEDGPKEPERVEAHIIPDEYDNLAKEAAEAVTEAAVLAKRNPGRFKMGVTLIAAGIKAIFTGNAPGSKPKNSKDTQRTKRSLRRRRS